MYEFLRKLDRRWVFLLMAAAVAGSVLAQIRLPERPSKHTQSAFRAIEDLPEGSKILMACDFDPASAGEVAPMAFAFTRHCCEKKHKLYYMTLWPLGTPMVQDNINIIELEYKHMQYGRDYVNLGYKSGMEGVIKPILKDLKQLFPTDHRGNSLKELPMTKDLRNIQQMDLIVSASAGYPGSKEWVQYAGVPFQINIVSGSTGVQAPQLFPYIPRPMVGLLAAIKGAAEYDRLLITAYPKLDKNERAKEGMRRMGTQLVAHLLMIFLIILGNVIFFIGRRKGEVR